MVTVAETVNKQPGKQKVKTDFGQLRFFPTESGCSLFENTVNPDQMASDEAI